MSCAQAAWFYTFHHLKFVQAGVFAHRLLQLTSGSRPVLKATGPKKVQRANKW